MSVAIRNQMRLQDWAALVLLSMLWGGSFFFVEVALTQLPPFTLVAMRVGLAALALWCLVLFTGMQIPRSLHVWSVFMVLGALNNALPFSLIVWGQTQITAGLAAILNATTPLFGVVLASFFLVDERASLAKILGVLIGFGGVVMIFASPAITGSAPLLPKLAVLLAAFAYAASGVYARRLRVLGVNPLVATAGQVSTAFLFLLLPVLYLDGVPDFTQWALPVWGAVVSVALLSTALAYIVYFSLLQKVGATNVMLVTLLVPVSAISLGALVLGESLEWTQLLGMLCIALGLLVIDGRLLKYAVGRV